MAKSKKYASVASAIRGTLKDEEPGALGRQVVDLDALKAARVTRLEGLMKGPYSIMPDSAPVIPEAMTRRVSFEAAKGMWRRSGQLNEADKTVALGKAPIKEADVKLVFEIVGEELAGELGLIEL